MFDFEDKVILVTGAAGNLGSAVAEAFLQSGGTVCGLDHRKGRLEDLKKSPQGDGKFYGFEEVDVTDKADMLALDKRIQNEVGTIDILVNTVGGFSMGEPVYGLSAETFNRMMNLNVNSFLAVTWAFVPGMIEKKAGKVISIGAKAALKGGAKSGAYSAAKSALLRLTESMSEELKPHNVQVNCVLSGIIDTLENRKAMPNADVTKWVTPQQVAEVIKFLSSPSSNVISGAAIPVYGR